MSQQEEWREEEGERKWEPDGEGHDLDRLFGDDYVIINGKSKRSVIDGRADRGPRDEGEA